MQTLTLLELNGLVRSIIEQTMDAEYWVEAELSECHENRGHCYMELIEKDPDSATPVARASAKCWKSKWMMVKPYFERITGQQLHAGLKVKLKVYAQFHEAYGFSWIVTDIDPTFTLGDMARKRQEIIRRLKDEGVFDMQKELVMPLFCQRIAVISTQTAAGYGDFDSQLTNNDFGLKFTTRLFPAIMQGEQVEQSVIAALNAINEQIDDFDCVVIIRGGGAVADMSGFDTLALAENVAQFPLPIITGIGHDRDESILDMVSHVRVKTPTAVAQYLIDHLVQVLSRIDKARQRITLHVQGKIDTHKAKLESLAIRIPVLFSLVKARQESELDRLLQRYVNSASKRLEQNGERLKTYYVQLVNASGKHFTKAQHQLQLLEQRTQALDPQLILNRGYSITLLNGKAISKASMLKTGDEIETRLQQGNIKSIVK